MNECTGISNLYEWLDQHLSEYAVKRKNEAGNLLNIVINADLSHVSLMEF